MDVPAIDVKWFGPIRTTGISEIAVPVGKLCHYCHEPFEAADSGIEDWQGDYFHRNCHLRPLIGSIAHVEQRCGCFIEGSEEGDPLHMTPRQAADAAVAAWEKKPKPWVN